jgi:uncharacterized protein YbjT (DUF2867 family)
MPEAGTTSTNRVLVTGATGRTGRHLVSQLLASGASFRAMARTPPSAGLPPGVEVVHGDLALPESLDSALAGVDSVFLVWLAPPTTAPAVIGRLARQARHIVFLSSPHQIQHPAFQAPKPNGVSAMHAEIERLIRASGMSWTFLRPGMFSANALWWWAEQIRTGDVVRWPHALAASAPIDDRDIATVAVRALTSGACAGGDYVLMGPQSLTHAEQVSIIGEVLGRRLRFEELTPEAWLRTLPPDQAPALGNMLLRSWAASIGHPAYLTPDFEEITGKPARTFHDWVVDNADAFKLGS